MEVFIEKTGETKNVSFSGTAKALLESLRVNSEEVIITRNNKIITLDQQVKDSDSIKVLSVISGG